MGVTNANKVINVDRIDCDGSLRVTLALTASPDIVSNPTDIVLVLDRSGSMAGTPLASMKTGAKTFIDIIDEATDSQKDGEIGSGSRIGVVSFANTPGGDAPPPPSGMSKRKPFCTKFSAPSIAHDRIAPPASFTSTSA